MADVFAGGHLRYLNSAWRDDNGDPVEIEQVVHAYWDSQNRCSNCCVPAISHDLDEEVEAIYLTRRCPYCGARMDAEVL